MDISEAFNNYFCNIAQKLKNDTSYDNKLTINTSHRHSSNMAVQECSELQTLEYIKSLKNKATSDTAIQPLKHVAKEIAPILQHLITSSFYEGIFPDLLKSAKVIPLHKSGCKTDVSIYRPISLLSCFSKIYENLKS